MSANLRIWAALGKTDPKHTKPFRRAGGFQGTATRPVYLLQKMTETFGPVGIGWGYSKPEFQVVNGGGEDVAVYCTVSMWVKDGDTRSEPFFGVGGDFIVKSQSKGLFTDDEAFKKAFTDALGNAMKHLGMSADVHMGAFDGSKYRDDDHQNDASEPQGRPQAASAPAPRNDPRAPVKPVPDAPTSVYQPGAGMTAGPPDVERAIQQMQRQSAATLDAWLDTHEDRLKALSAEDKTRFRRAVDQHRINLLPVTAAG